jgi:O-antigen ligase
MTVLFAVTLPPILFVFLFSEAFPFRFPTSLGGRVPLWIATIEAVANAPLRGYGAQPASQIISPYLTGNSRDPHTFMTVFLSAGIIGGTAYFATIYYALRSSLGYNMNEMRSGIIALAIGLLAIDFFHGFSLFGFSMGTLLLGTTIGYASIPEELRSTIRSGPTEN